MGAEYLYTLDVVGDQPGRVALDLYHAVNGPLHGIGVKGGSVGELEAFPQFKHIAKTAINDFIGLRQLGLQFGFTRWVPQ